MKKIILSFLFLFSIAAIGWSQQTVDYDKLEKDWKTLLLNGKPFTGNVQKLYDNGQVAIEGKVVNGLREGEWKWYYPTGKLKRTSIYKKGKKNGKTVYYWPNGNKRAEIYFYEDKNVRQISWDKNGKRKPNPQFKKFH
jgi:antitoxin component YwqK of YwqJK toxin-antitoxin module